MNFEKMRKARKYAKMTQEELAEKLGVNRATVSKYENGTIEPSIAQTKKIAESIGITTFDLIDPDESTKSAAEFAESILTLFALLNLVKEDSRVPDDLKKVIETSSPNMQTIKDTLMNYAFFVQRNVAHQQEQSKAEKK